MINKEEYLKELDKAKKMKNSIGSWTKDWSFPTEMVELYKEVNCINLGQFHRAYANVFNYSYQQVYKFVSKHSLFLQQEGLLEVRNKGKANSRNVYYVYKDDAKQLAKFIKKYC